MKKILVGVDGSELSNGAVRFAAALAKQTGAELQLATALVPPIFYGADATAETVELQDASAHALAKKALDESEGQLDPHAPRPARFLLDGPAADALATLAASNQVDLVVVGHRGRNAIARVMLGSVADRLVQISTRPVLVFR